MVKSLLFNVYEFKKNLIAKSMGVVGGYFNFNGAIKTVYITIEKKMNDINYNIREARQAEFICKI